MMDVKAANRPVRRSITGPIPPLQGSILELCAHFGRAIRPGSILCAHSGRVLPLGYAFVISLSGQTFLPDDPVSRLSNAL